jgi:hypothetical protein
VIDGLAISRGRPDGVTIPAIWIAFALSLLLHAAVLWQWLPQLRLNLPSPDETKPGEGGGSLVVRLAPAPSPPPSPPPTPKQSLPPPVPPRARPPMAAARAQPLPPAIALRQPAPEITPPTAPAASAPAPESDLAAYIEARRRARAPQARAAPAESAATMQPVEDDKARSDRIVAANLGSTQAQTFGYDPKQGGGVFQITRMGYDTAEFAFFGWNREARRNTKQLIDVRRGDSSDIRLAVVRKMIAIIREYEQEDFLWESQRLGRSLTLSARASDNAGLEDFMMREFYFDARAPR